MRLLTRSSRRTYCRHPGQTALSVLGIALGVAVVLAIELTTVGAQREFERAADSVGGHATHVIAGGSHGFDEALYRRLRIELAVRAAAPVVIGDARRLTASGERAGMLQIVGVDPFAEAPLRPYFAFGGGTAFDLTALLTEPGACALVGEANGPELGDVLSIEVLGVRHRLVVRALLAPRDPVIARGLAAVLLVDLATAQEVLGRVGRLDRIDLALRGPGSDAELAAIRAILPADVDLQDVAARRAALGDMTRAFRLNLRALGLLTLLVGAFLIFNTVSFAVVRRRRQFGVLRALGARRRSLFGMVLTEALALGVVGTALGIGLGMLLAQLLLGVVTATIQDHYFTVAMASVAPTWWDLGVAAALGLTTCGIAALAPALDAMRVPPREVMLFTPSAARRRSRMRRAAGLALCAASCGALALAFGDGASVGVAYFALFALLLGAAGWTPLWCGALAWVARPVCARLFGVMGDHAARAVRADLGRTAVATAALMLAVATTVGLGSMIDSFRTGIDRWLRGALVADVFVSAPASIGERFRVSLAPDVQAALPQIEGVAAAAAYRRFEVDARLDAANGRGGAGSTLRMRCVAIDGVALLAESFELLDGGDARVRTASLESPEDDRVLVSEPLAFRLGITRGAAVWLRGREGLVRFLVDGVFYDYGSEVGYAVMAEATRARHFDDVAVAAFGLFVEPGVEADAVVESIRSRFAEHEQRLTVQSSDGLRTASLEVFDRTFAITAALRALCLLVAFLGIWSALMSLQLERRREIGVLRAIGATPRQIRASVTTQTGLLGLGAGTFALPVGAALGWILVHVINKRSFGWTLLTFEVPWMVLAEAVVLAVVAALLAGWHPAVRFARVRVALALREDS